MRTAEAEKRKGEEREAAAPGRIQACPFLPLCPAAVMGLPQKGQ